MSQILSTIGNNLQGIIEQGGYILIFIITILEGLPIIGQFVPGHTTVLIAGFLVKLDIFKLSIIIPVIVVSAMIGDAIGYFLGKKYGFAFFTKFGSIFFIKPEHIERATNLVKEHPAKTIILGRFSPITRPLSPFIVGASGTHSRFFWLYDFIAVILWALPSLAVGYIFGASYHVVAPIMGKYIFIAILIGIIIIWGYRFINKKFHIFAKYDLITYTLKNMVERIRPESQFLIETGYSFPSGHASIATIFFVLLIYLFIIKIKSLVLREILIAGSVILIILTSFSRVYLGVHWLSDVLAGIGLGLFWTTAMILFVKYITWVYENLKGELN